MRQRILTQENLDGFYVVLIDALEKRNYISYKEVQRMLGVGTVTAIRICEMLSAQKDNLDYINGLLIRTK